MKTKQRRYHRNWFEWSYLSFHTRIYIFFTLFFFLSVASFIIFAHLHANKDVIDRFGTVFCLWETYIGSMNAIDYKPLFNVHCSFGHLRALKEKKRKREEEKKRPIQMRITGQLIGRLWVVTTGFCDENRNDLLIFDLAKSLISISCLYSKF